MATIKQFSRPTGFLLLATFALLLTTSCNNNGAPGKNSVVIEIPEDHSGLDKIDHFIPEEKIKQYQADFKIDVDSLAKYYPSLLLPEAEAFNKRAILSLLKAPDCVGIRVYHGVKKGGRRDEVRVILVGVDSNGKDILISKGSVLVARITQDGGGIETGQCPTCQQ